MAKPNRLYESEPVLRTSPLSRTHYAVSISGGLADVSLTRTFRNAQSRSVEGVLTFPMPIHAILYELEARIDGRALRGVAEAKGEARDTYEDAVEAGYATILHEEVLRGVHQISLGQLHAGADIAVTVRFAIALSQAGGAVSLRIPTTVGDIYGRSNLFECDELVHSDAPQAGTINAAVDNGTLQVNGRPMVGVPEIISLNMPIDIEVHGWKPRELRGIAADGRNVSLKVSPSALGDSPLDMAVLVDCSGSMGEAWSDNQSKTKYDVVRKALTDLGSGFDARDRVELWDFQDEAVRVGSLQEEDWISILKHVRKPGGGTEIGSAIMAAQAERKIRDVLLLTDGKSHALPIQFLARSGTRFSVVLIGDDSLEANVGHLAALTSGHVLVPVQDSQVASALKDTLGHLRKCPERSSEPGCETVRGGMKIAARWKSSSSDTMEHGNRAVAAYAASLMLPSLSDDEAARLAATEGLVTHLTSLVLVDRDGVQRRGTPDLLKLPLSSPVHCSKSARYMYAAPRARPVRAYSRDAISVTSGPRISCYHDLADAFDWRDLDARETVVVGEDELVLPDDTELPKSAKKLGLKPHILLLWILADLAKLHDDAADRIQARLRDGVEPERIQAITAVCTSLLEAAMLQTSRQVEKDNFKPRRISKPNGAVRLARRIPWEEQYDQLIAGDISGLQGEVIRAISDLALHADVVAASERAQRTPIATTLSLLARLIKCEELYAGRVESQLWKKLPMDAWLFLTDEGMALINRLLGP